MYTQSLSIGPAVSMGASYPHFNISSLSYIVCTQQADILKLIELYRIKCPESDERMNVTREILQELLVEANIHESGLFIDIFQLLYISKTRVYSSSSSLCWIFLDLEKFLSWSTVLRFLSPYFL
jgi:hypothetical protein